MSHPPGASDPSNARESAEAESLGLRQRFLGAGFWIAGSRIFLGVFSMAVTMVLARLLSPEDYGLLAMAMVFVGLINQTNDVGLGHALVRQEHVDADLQKVAFSYALVSSLALYACLYLLSPLLGSFYGEPRVVPILRFLSLTFVIRSFYVVPMAMMRREMRMRSTSMVQIVSTVVDASGTIALALAGFGVWALAGGQIMAQVVLAIGLSLAQGWSMGFRFHHPHLREVLSFVAGVTGSILLWYWYVSADTLIIGRFLGGAALGVYAMSMNLSKQAWNRLWMTINPILLPLFSQARKRPGDLGRVFLKVSHTVALVVMPASIGLALVSSEAVPVLLSSKWNAVIVPLRWLCILGVSRALVVITSPVLQAVGRVRLDVRFNLACGILLPVSFMAVLPLGVTGVAAAWAIIFPLVAILVQLRAVLHETGITFRRYVAALSGPTLAVLVMSAAVLTLGATAPLSTVPMLVAKTVVGGGVYAVAITWFIHKPYSELRRMFKDVRAGVRA